MAAILTDAMRKAAGRALLACNTCRPTVEFLRNVGLPSEEEERRLEHLNTLANTMLELDAASREEK